MIKLKRTKAPHKLTPLFVSTKTAKFKADGKKVWGYKWLSDALLDYSFDKCCYCECDISEESKFMEVEHFYDKDRYPDKVLEWKNLLPSCKRCNGAKLTHNVAIEPIIDPTRNNPVKYFYMNHFHIKGKRKLGKTSEGVLDLNNLERAVNCRFEISMGLIRLIDSANDKLESYKESKSTIRRNKLLGVTQSLLLECLPESEYSATCSTVLHTTEAYQDLKKELIKERLWKPEFDRMHIESLKIKLERR
jgi:uncharacterized protein (TIGR02646 family)